MIQLSGGNYGGYVINGKKAELISKDEEGNDVVVDSVSCTVNGTTYNVQGWLYDTARSVGSDTAEYIGMA